MPACGCQIAMFRNGAGVDRDAFVAGSIGMGAAGSRMFECDTVGALYVAAADVIGSAPQVLEL